MGLRTKGNQRTWVRRESAGFQIGLRVTVRVPKRTATALIVYSVLGTSGALSAFEEGFIIPILQMGKLRHRAVNRLASCRQVLPDASVLIQHVRVYNIRISSPSPA